MKRNLMSLLNLSLVDMKHETLYIIDANASNATTTVNANGI